MGQSSRLRLHDVRAAFRLVGECRDLGYDPDAWGRHMFAGLCRLTGARAANGGEVRQALPGGPVEGITYFDAGFEPWEHNLYSAFLRTHGLDRHPIAAGNRRAAALGQRGRVAVRTRCQLVPDREWYESAAYNECHRVIQIDHCLVSTFELPAGGWFNCILLHRATGDSDFAPRHRHLLRVFHEELGRLIGPVLMSAGDPYSPTRLPPRVREVLSCLLEGDSEKQAAARMGLSRSTVHQYVEFLYRHYGVASRAELLARVLRRTRPSG
jgi:DNA-binding CsgD family transcriptional regulator